MGKPPAAITCSQLFLRGHEGRGSIQKTQEKEKHSPVILLVSARVSTNRTSKNDGQHVYNDRDPFACRKCVRHKNPRFKPSAVSVLFLLQYELFSVARCPCAAACSRRCFSAANNSPAVRAFLMTAKTND